MKKIFARRKEGDDWRKALFCFEWQRIRRKNWIIGFSFSPFDFIFKVELWRANRDI